MSRFEYPQLSLERIIQLLNQVTTVTKTDLTEPNSDFITNIFPPILVYINCLREDHRLVEFADLEQLNSPDMHVDSVKMINLYHTIKKVIAALDCPIQFNLKDIVKPEADRTQFFFSTILNFCLHREHRMNKVQPMVGEIKVLAYQGRELDERISQLNDEISELNEAKEREMPFVQEIATKIKEMQQEITALNNQLHSLKITISKASTEMDQKISSADLALKRTAQENRSLHSKFVQSLDKLQRTLEERKIAQVEAKDAERATMQSSHEQTATDEVYTKMAPSDKKAKKDKWSEEETLALCEFLNKYVNDNGRHVQFKWVEIQPKFATLFKRTFISEKALKNKFDGMKRDYNLWTSLKNGETGLGWDASANKLDCSDEWWERKIKEDPNFKKLRKKQPSLELQYAWDQLFGDAVAGGGDCVSTSMDAKAFKEVHHKNVEAEDVESDDDPYGSQDGTQLQNSDIENERPGFFKSFLDEVNLGDTTTPPNQNQNLNQNQSGIPKKINKPTKSNTKPKTINMKRRGRQSGESAMLKEHLAQSKATQQRVIQHLESETSTNNQSDKFSIDAVASVINHLIEAKLIVKGSMMWLFAMDLFEDPVKREMFMSMLDDECRMTWLQHKQNKST